MDDSVITCGKVMKKKHEERIKTIPTSFSEKIQLVKHDTKLKQFCVGSNKLKMSDKDINIKNRTYYFFDDFINIRDLDPNNIKIDEKTYKNIFIYYIGYVTIKKDLKMYSVNTLYLIFNKVNGYLKEITGNKYLTQVPTNESKEKFKRYGKIWSNIRDLIRSITKNSENYDKKYMKIQFNSDDKLPLNKTVENPIMTIVVRAAFLENNKYYPQILLDKCLYKI